MLRCRSHRGRRTSRVSGPRPAKQAQPWRNCRSQQWQQVRARQVCGASDLPRLSVPHRQRAHRHNVTHETQPGRCETLGRATGDDVSAAGEVVCRAGVTAVRRAARPARRRHRGRRAHGGDPAGARGRPRRLGLVAAPARQRAPVGARAAGWCARRLLPECRRHLGAGRRHRRVPGPAREGAGRSPRVARPTAPDQRGGSRRGAGRRAPAPAGRAPGSRAAVRDRILRRAEPAGRPVRVRRRRRPAVRPAVLTGSTRTRLVGGVACPRGRGSGSRRAPVATSTPSTSPPRQAGSPSPPTSGPTRHIGSNVFVARWPWPRTTLPPYDGSGPRTSSTRSPSGTAPPPCSGTA